MPTLASHCSKGSNDLDLVALHIYSPPLLRMGTYSLTERTRGEELWVVGDEGI